MWSVALVFLAFFAIANAQCDCQSEINDLKNIVLSALGHLIQSDPKSCADVLNDDPSAKSGEYTIETEDGEKQVYCEMDKLPGCGDTGGWQRIGTFQKTPITDCPPGYTDEGKFFGRACGRTIDAGCSESIKFDTDGQSYTEVCGKVAGYQFGTGDSFRRYTSAGNVNDIDTPYLDGISITRGSPRVHLWSYTVSQGNQPSIICPCTGKVKDPIIPNFVGEDYYCEGAAGKGFFNVLWDGLKCSAAENNGCCKKQNPNIPWFHRSGLEPSSDEIELRICSDEGRNNEQFPFFEYEFYIR